MKHKGYRALALVLVLALVGVAYAWWTDAIFVRGTAETGEMDVRFRTTGTVAVDGKYDSINIDSIANDKVTVTVEDLYPRLDPWDGSAYATLTVNIKNDGTVPVVMENVEVTRVSGSTPLYNSLRTAIRQHVGDPFWLNQAGGVPVDPTLVLEPGEDTSGKGWGNHFTSLIWLDENADNDLQNRTVTFELTYNYKQANKP